MVFQIAPKFVVLLLIFLSLGAEAIVRPNPNECQDVSLVVDALRLQRVASAYCSSILQISTVTIGVTATVPTVSITTTVSVETDISGVTIATAPVVTTVVPSVS
jgi:hypothetical protein